MLGPNWVSKGSDSTDGTDGMRARPRSFSRAAGDRTIRPMRIAFLQLACVAAYVCACILPAPARAEAPLDSLSPVPAAFRFASARSGEIPGVVEALATRTPKGAVRTVAASAAFLGAPYLRSPLGEGSGIDPDPRLRWDGVDCLTLVETAMALGNAATVDEVSWFLDDIRYADGKAPHFQSRLHLMMAQWVPDLVRKGYVRDVTHRFGGEAVIEATIDYDEARWRRRPGSLRALPWQEELRGSHTLPMIPLAAARKIAGDLPEGVLLNVVRAARPDRINRITHTGLVVVRDGKRYVRHASTHRLEVIDEPIDRFLTRHGAMRKWLVDGIHLLEIRDNHERIEKVKSTVVAIPAAASPVGTAAGEPPADL